MAENPILASSVLVVEVVVIVQCSSNSCSSTFMKGLQEEAIAIKKQHSRNRAVRSSTFSLTDVDYSFVEDWRSHSAAAP